MKKEKAFRVKHTILQDVCVDCCDFIRKVKIDCGKCPLKSLIRRQGVKWQEKIMVKGVQ